MIDYTFNAKVSRVIDGDTLDAVIDLGFHTALQMRFRLAHLDAPEVGTQEGREVRDWLKETLEGKDVVLTSSKADKYGRYLATLWLAGQNINDVLLRTGRARPYEGGAR